MKKTQRKIMSHPYEKHENSPHWKEIEHALNTLIENKDVILQTDKAHVIGYLVQSLFPTHQVENKTQG